MNQLEPPHTRVLMTTDTAGGVWDYSIELASGLRSLGVATVLAVIGEAPSAFQLLEADAIPDLCLEQRFFRLEWMENPEEDLKSSGDWLMHLNEKYDPDLVQANSYAYACLPWERPCVVVAHSCILSWWRQVKKEPAPKTYCSYAERVAAGLRRAHRVVFLTEFSRRTTEELYGRFARSEVIWNGRNPSRYASAQKEPFILSAGRLWDEAKNISALDCIAEELPWPILMAGTCKEPNGCERRPRNARYLGVLSSREIADMFSKAAIFAHPARYEPFGLAVLEAALSGCALVLGDIPTLKELWKGAALFVPADDRKAIQSRILSLIGKPSLMSLFGQKARSWALNYTSGKMCREYFRLYRDLLRMDDNGRAKDHGPE